jgi:hypothetical protein
LAWEEIKTHSPPLSVVVLDNLLLKKLPNGKEWLPMIYANSNSDETQIRDRFYFYNVLTASQLLSISLPPPVENFLLFLCRWLLRLCRSENCGAPPPEDEETEERMLNWLNLIRQGYVPEQQRIKMEQIAEVSKLEVHKILIMFRISVRWC